MAGPMVGWPGVLNLQGFSMCKFLVLLNFFGFAISWLKGARYGRM